MDNVLLDVGLPLVLAFVMVGIGLTLTVADFDRQRRTPKPLVVGVIGMTTIVPAFSYLLAIWLDLAPELAIGLVLLGATAGGTTSNVLTYLAGGNTALSLVLTVVANLASIISIPIWASLALDRWGATVAEAVNVTVSVVDVAGILVALVLVPTSLGMVIRAKKPALAARLENTVSKVSAIVLFVVIVGAALTLEDAWELLRQAGPATLLLACVATATGFGLGVLTRMPRPGHVALGMEFGIKNITLTLLLGVTALGSEAVALTAAVYGVVAYVPGVILLVFARRGYVSTPLTGGTAAGAREDRKPVLVGYDGSEATMPALRWAAREAVGSQRRLRVLLAWGLPTMGFSPVSASADLDRHKAEAALASAVYLLQREVTGLSVDGELVQDKPAQALVDRSAEAGLVVVGYSGKGRVGRFVLGSVSSAVVTHAAAPVVVVRGDDSGQVRRVGPIVVGVDGSPGSEDAVRHAMTVAPLYGYRVVAVHAGEPGSSPGGLAALSPALAAGREQHPAVQVREVVEPGNAAQLIAAEARDAALVVVGSRGHGGLAGMLLGSVCRGVIDQAECSVMVMREATGQEARAVTAQGATTV
ncbi:MAG: universal stress protein [Candidatus Nanopelagicales bacterium]|jgi:BASS family bile acid:Na+ symporter|nr:universal stress protein [Candidatus Nanopelagicales bacterium]